MRTKADSQSGFLGSRAFVILLLCAAASSILAGTLLAFLRPGVPAKALPRTLTFAERVEYQRALEDVHWRHRIWPKERPDAKPSLDAVMSLAQLEEKVADYLRNSQMLEDYWQRPLTAEQLQAEMDRMAQHTKQPEVLHELFEALGNDPFVIAECLARPVLSERLVTNFYPHHKAPLDSLRASAENRMPKLMVAASANYTLPTISDGPNGCIDDTWASTSTTNVPTARVVHTAVWTGSEMIVWGGQNVATFFNTGGRYDPSTDTWAPTSTTNAPEARRFHTAVWTGSEMIVWGGVNQSGDVLGTGGKYNPSTDSWTATSTTSAPTARTGHTAVWTGSEMIVWGGFSSPIRPPLNTGGRYDPTTNSWTATSTTNTPTGRFAHTAVCTGTEMIVWGGEGQAGSGFLSTGGRYNPGTDSWMPTSTTNAPTGRIAHTAVRTDSEMIVWGGIDINSNHLNTGGRYNPGTDGWAPTSITNAPSGRAEHTAVWTDSEMIVWGGFNGASNLNTGGRYNPNTDSWAATNTNNAPIGREGHTAVWSDIEMIVWGGAGDSGDLNTGGRYCAQSGSPTPTPTATPTPTLTPTPSATATPTPTATATPTAMPRVTPRPRPTPHPRPTPPG